MQELEQEGGRLSWQEAVEWQLSWQVVEVCVQEQEVGAAPSQDWFHWKLQNYPPASCLRRIFFYQTFQNNNQNTP